MVSSTGIFRGSRMLALNRDHWLAHFESPFEKRRSTAALQNASAPLLTFY